MKRALHIHPFQAMYQVYDMYRESVTVVYSSVTSMTSSTLAGMSNRVRSYLVPASCELSGHQYRLTGTNYTSETATGF